MLFTGASPQATLSRLTLGASRRSLTTTAPYSQSASGVQSQIRRQWSQRPVQSQSQRAVSDLHSSSTSIENALHRPSPPRLPKEEQELFESLQRQSTGAFSTPRSSREAAADSSSSTSSGSQTQHPTVNDRESPSGHNAARKSSSDEKLHPNVRRGAPPEFEGKRNPRTGEVGGPKNDPLRWGGDGEWSYNGRTTDF